MDIIKIRFAADFEDIGSDIERTIEDMFRSLSPVFNLAERSWKPSMDMNETPEQIIILAGVAGVNKDDLEVEISSKAVRIRAMRPPRNCGPDATYRLPEIQYVGLSVSFFCPPRLTRKLFRRPTPTECWKSDWPSCHPKRCVTSRWRKASRKVLCSM